MTYPDRICYRPDVMFASACVLLPEGVRIGECATCPLGESEWSLLRIVMRVTCHQGEGSLQGDPLHAWDQLQEIWTTMLVVRDSMLADDRSSRASGGLLSKEMDEGKRKRRKVS